MVLRTSSRYLCPVLYPSITSSASFPLLLVKSLSFRDVRIKPGLEQPDQTQGDIRVGVKARGHDALIKAVRLFVSQEGVAQCGKGIDQGGFLSRQDAVGDEIRVRDAGCGKDLVL